MENKFEFFLFGYAYRALKEIQLHLINGKNAEALSCINEDVRYLNDNINLELK